MLAIVSLSYLRLREKGCASLKNKFHLSFDFECCLWFRHDKCVEAGVSVRGQDTFKCNCCQTHQSWIICDVSTSKPVNSLNPS